MTDDIITRKIKDVNIMLMTKDKERKKMLNKIIKEIWSKCDFQNEFDEYVLMIYKDSGKEK